MARVDGVRDYNRIRRFLSHIYLYGFFSREDFARYGIGSVQDYDYGTRLLRAVFPDSEEAAVRQGGRKYLRIRRQYAPSGEMSMPDSYLLYAMDMDEDLPALLIILSALSSGSKTAETLCAAMELWLWREEQSRYAKTRRMALALEEYGYVKKQGRTFSLSKSTVSVLTDKQLNALYEYVSFTASICYPRVAGTYFRRCLEREMLQRGLSFPEQPAVLLRHNATFGVFDEDLVYQILFAIKERRPIYLTLENGEHLNVVPARLRADTRLGRWYLLAAEKEGPLFLRVGNIRTIRTSTPISEMQWTECTKPVLTAFVASGCSGALSGERPVEVEVELHFPSASGIRAQFAREIRLGEIFSKKGSDVYHVYINDPNELIPLLRSYSPWIRICPGNHDLDTRLRADLEKMRDKLKGGDAR